MLLGLKPVALGLNSRGDIGMAQFSCGRSVDEASSMERGEKPVALGLNSRGDMLIASLHTFR
jgi:hypothetical protein